MPEPPQQENMVTPPPASASNVALIGLVGMIAFASGIACVYASRPRNTLDPADRGNLALRNAGAGLVVLGLIGAILAGLLLLAGD
jgi:hypothetical protein